MTKNSHILTPDLVILGIGNPGPQYANTRHNVGFWFIDQIAEQEGVELKRQKNLVRTSSIQLDNRSIILAKSRTFVNVSGDAAETLFRDVGYDPVTVGGASREVWVMEVILEVGGCICGLQHGAPVGDPEPGITTWLDNLKSFELGWPREMQGRYRGDIEEM